MILRRKGLKHADFLNASLETHTKRTDDEAQQFIWQQAGGDEGYPQTNVELLSQLWPDPHEQTKHTNTR